MGEADLWRWKFISKDSVLLERREPGTFSISGVPGSSAKGKGMKRTQHRKASSSAGISQVWTSCFLNKQYMKLLLKLIKTCNERIP